MSKPFALVLLVLAAGCGTSTEDTWGGYTESQAKEILAMEDVRETIIGTTPRTSEEEPVSAIYPTEDELERADLRKVTVQGQEAWEYNDSPNQFCLYAWHDSETDGYVAQSSRCVAD